MRKVIIAGNWKMHKTSAETRSYIKELSAVLDGVNPDSEILAAPPFTSLAVAVEEAKGTRIGIAGQNLHWEDKGAFTGEISGPMLRELGCSHVIIGHSERRQYFGETDEKVNLKIAAAMNHSLIPIFCLGESLDERESGKTFDVVKRQLLGGIGDLRPLEPKNFVIAYEPVWAIGTGRTATPEQAQEVHAFLRKELSLLLGKDFANSVRILYGGSIKPDNASTLVSCEDIDGGLIGGASLKVQDFFGIIKEGI
ncbi:MAG: triose-phosphate isomerase [Desulfomonile tiedjei]|uniref:Triosephosphate isomerase n=1 Tax=Desulfomonile tiedjei TaxID=2358 RepID=A0A9D6Z251_9BACT|nr:triose-phosphate isomerase [Desulfomonile tiedjei]